MLWARSASPLQIGSTSVRPYDRQMMFAPTVVKCQDLLNIVSKICCECVGNMQPRPLIFLVCPFISANQ